VVAEFLLISVSGAAIQEEFSDKAKDLFADDTVAGGGFWYALDAIGALSLDLYPPEPPVAPPLPVIP
jgi:hypothetical protein